MSLAAFSTAELEHEILRRKAVEYFGQAPAATSVFKDINRVCKGSLSAASEADLIAAYCFIADDSIAPG